MTKVFDLRSDLMAPRSERVAEAMRVAALGAPAMTRGEDPHERALSDYLCAELGVEAVLLVPTCTMANQIAIRLALPDGGVLASAARAHIVTTEAKATGLTGVTPHALPHEDGHPSPETVETFLSEQTAGQPTLVWLENTQMLSAGSVMPVGWQTRIGDACRARNIPVHLDGSRLWNAAVAQGSPMSAMTQGTDTIALSLNKAIGAPVGSILAGSRAAIEAATEWRNALGGEWRPIGPIAAAALAALDGWRERLTADMHVTRSLAEAIVARLGEDAVRPAPSNLIFLHRPEGDAAQFVEQLAANKARVLALGPKLVRLAIHGGMRFDDVGPIANAICEANLLRRRQEETRSVSS